MKVESASHSLPCSFYENGLFRNLIISSRETLSDTLNATFMFNATDKARHAQDIILYQLELLDASHRRARAGGRRAVRGSRGRSRVRHRGCPEGRARTHPPCRWCRRGRDSPRTR